MSFWRDSKGNLVLYQKPNLPLVVGLVAWLLSKFLPGRGATAAGLVEFGGLFTWAWLEAFDGDAPYRRVLGFLLMVLLVLDRL